MARYRIDETPEPGAPQAPDNLEIVSVIFGLVIGIGFVYTGLRARQYWLAIWGAGLSLSSLAYFVYQLLV